MHTLYTLYMHNPWRLNVTVYVYTPLTLYPMHAPPAEIEGDNIACLPADDGRDQFAAPEAAGEGGAGGAGGAGGGGGYVYSCIIQVNRR